eukprot:359517-Chlamydomonas_euryale.AAC.10
MECPFRQLTCCPSCLTSLPPAATTRQRPTRRHNAYLRRITGMSRRPDGTLHPTAQMCAAAGVPQVMCILSAARLTRLGHVAGMPDESMVQQLLFAEGLVGLGGMVGRPRSTWRDMALSALRPVLTSRLAGRGWYEVAHYRAQWRAL